MCLSFKPSSSSRPLLPSVHHVQSLLVRPQMARTHYDRPCSWYEGSRLQDASKKAIPVPLQIRSPTEVHVRPRIAKQACLFRLQKVQGAGTAIFSHPDDECPPPRSLTLFPLLRAQG